MAGVLSSWSSPQGQRSTDTGACDSAKSYRSHGREDAAESFRLRCLQLADEHEHIIFEYQALVSRLKDVEKADSSEPHQLESADGSLRSISSEEMRLEVSGAVPALPRPPEGHISAGWLSQCSDVPMSKAEGPG